MISMVVNVGPGDWAKPIKPVSVSFGPSTGPHLSVSVMVEDVAPIPRDRERNSQSSFRPGSP